MNKKTPFDVCLSYPQFPSNPFQTEQPTFVLVSYVEMIIGQFGKGLEVGDLVKVKRCLDQTTSKSSQILIVPSLIIQNIVAY